MSKHSAAGSTGPCGCWDAWAERSILASAHQCSVPAPWYGTLWQAWPPAHVLPTVLLLALQQAALQAQKDWAWYPAQSSLYLKLSPRSPPEAASASKEKGTS